MASGRSPRPYLTARERVAQRRGTPPPIRKRSRARCLPFLGALIAVLVVAGALLALVISWAANTLQSIEQADPRRGGANAGRNSEALPDTLRTPFNVLLVGVDKREDPNDGVRGDTLIVVHVNPDGRWAAMLSIPRDSVVTIPQFGMQKINNAYSLGASNAADLYGAGTSPAAGGGALAAETVERFLGIKIHYIAQVDFRGFQRIVDTLGGVTVDVPQPLLDAEYPTDDYGVERVYVPAGLQVMDGRSALIYARSRHSGSDFDRSRRQQQVLQAILREVRERGLLAQVSLLPQLAQDLEQSVVTTLPLSDIGALQGLAALAQDLTPERVLRFSINPNDVALISEQGSDIYWNQDDVQRLVARMMAGPGDNNSEAARIQVQNGAGVEGLATRVSDHLTAQGFEMTPAGDAPAVYERTTIIDYTGRPQTRQRLAALLGIEPGYVLSPAPADAPPAPDRTDIVIVLGQDYQERWAGNE